ncbi:ribosome-associated translation inhibitor RaiA [Acidiferrobacter sp.]|uniref:ribosome hibernation-promoting factor, HPF/YfiA family n=1 Tax=Acidiferrobacter sp. TaxID=1872107 RepID=UPI00261BDEDD|nr:ribosome-associated translation inhibitor RaiA [Acidiferrobacter sp.]
MDITVSGQQVEITPPLRDYVLEKVGRIQRHFDHAITADVVLHVEKKRYTAEANVRAKGAVIHADATGQDMYAAVDLLADKLDRQILRHKEKVTDQHRSG